MVYSIVGWRNMKDVRPDVPIVRETPVNVLLGERTLAGKEKKQKIVKISLHKKKKNVQENGQKAIILISRKSESKVANKLIIKKQAPGILNSGGRKSR